MVQNETNLVVADNSGARSVRVFHLLGGSVRRASSVGDVVICAVKDALPNGKIKKGDIVKIDGKSVFKPYLSINRGITVGKECKTCVCLSPHSQSA